jgi:hypothetical protein
LFRGLLDGAAVIGVLGVDEHVDEDDAPAADRESAQPRIWYATAVRRCCDPARFG